METTGTVTSRDGTALAYARTGDGPSVVLVGGALCRGIAEDAPLAAELAAHGFSVFTYDRRGRGGSGDTPPYAVAREIEDVAAVLAAAGPDAALHGTSSGGALALEAVAAGLAVSRVSAYEPPWSTDRTNVPRHRAATDRLRELADAGRRGDAVEAFVADTGAPPETIAELRRSPMWAQWEELAPTLAYDYEVLGDSLVPSGRLARIRVPLLVVNGTETFPFVAEAAPLVARAAPQGTHRTLEGQHHEADPKALAPVLADFHGAHGFLGVRGVRGVRGKG